MNTIFLFLWLALGGVFRFFDFGKWNIPIAAWLSPVFLLHFSHQNNPLVGISIIWIVVFLAAYFPYMGVIPVPGIGFPLVIAAYSTVWTLPYLFDHLLFASMPGFLSTIIFPLTWVVVEYINSKFNPFGTWGSVAYTQYGNHSLVQIASITGIWGITFLVTWFGSTLNWVWENQVNWEVVQGGVFTYGLILITVLIFGGMRLALAHSTKTVCVAAIGWPDELVDRNKVMQIFGTELSSEIRQEFRQTSKKLQDYFLEKIELEADSGAKIVMWPEANVMILKEDEPTFLESAKRVAIKQQVYLLMGVATVQLEANKPLENKAILMNPRGEIVSSYTKTRLVPGFEVMKGVSGDGKIRTYDSQYGRIASAICFDMDFPNLIRQAGRANVDFMLIPASDWEPIKYLHHNQAVFRAIENGASMVRAARWGISAAVDAYGHTLAVMDSFLADNKTMSVQLPVTGVRTIYSRIGDLFAWLCMAGLAGSITWAIS